MKNKWIAFLAAGLCLVLSSCGVSISLKDNPMPPANPSETSPASYEAKESDIPDSDDIVGLWIGGPKGLDIYGENILAQSRIQRIMFFEDGTSVAGNYELGYVDAFTEEDREQHFGSYTYENGSGEISFRNTTEKLSVSGGVLSFSGKDLEYFRAADVEGLKFDGLYYNGKLEECLKPGKVPVLRFDSNGGFENFGMFSSVSDDLSGAGKYEIKDFTLLLNYDTGMYKHFLISLMGTSSDTDTLNFMGRVMKKMTAEEEAIFTGRDGISPSGTSSASAAPVIEWIPEGQGCASLVVTYSGSVEEGLPDMRFKVYGWQDEENKTYHATGLDAISADGKKNYLSTEFETYCPLENLGLILADANADGYKDILLFNEMIGAHGHLSYMLFLWDQKAGAFSKQVESFYEILNPVVDEKAGVVRSLAAESSYTDIYRIYRFLNGEFYLAGELELTRETDGVDEMRTYAEYQYTNSKAQLVNEFAVKTDLGGPPISNEKPYYEPDSLWQLGSPLWCESLHFSEIAYAEDMEPDERYYGNWMATDAVGSGYADRYVLDPSGSFIFGANEMTDKGNVRYKAGLWMIKKGVLYLVIDAKVIDDNGSMRYEVNETSEKENYPIGKINLDPVTGKDTVKLGGVKYYEFDNQDDLFDSFYEMESSFNSKNH